MSKPASSAALPIAHVVLRILIVVNWLSGAAVAALLVVMPNRQWIMSAFHLSPSPDADQLIIGMRAIAAVFLVAIPLHYVVLKRLLAIVETVRAGDPFVAAQRAPFAGDRLDAARAAASQPRRRRDRQGCFDASASAPSPGRLFDQRLARRAPHVPAGPRVRRRHAHARRARRDGLTWRSPSSSTTSFTIGG